MGKNQRSFLSWQGNSMEYWKGSTFVTVGLIFLSLFIIIIFKKRIVAWITKKENEKVLFFKNINSFLMWSAIVMLIYFIFREIILIGFEFPKKWEYIPIHLCRLHTIIITLFFAFRKKEWNKYISIISFLGAVFGLAFGSLSESQAVLDDKSSIFNHGGIKYYSTGPDTLFFWDFLSSHYFIAIVPLIFTLSSKRVTKKEFWFSIAAYYGVAIILWIINYATSFATDQAWRSNYWYLATNDVNPFSDILGPITSWPYNIVLTPLLASISAVLIHTLSLCGKNWKANLKEFYSIKWKKTQSNK